MIRTFSGEQASQRRDELEPFIALLNARNARSYLEIGARHGDSFHAVMSGLPIGSVGVTIDLPGSAWGRENSAANLMRAAADLRAKGYRITTVFGDSRAPENIARAAEQGPFDAILIDGDHRYEGVSADWKSYGPMAPIVAFHDIVNSGKRGRATSNPDAPRQDVPVEVHRLWSELKAGRDAEFHEFIGAGSPMGIGVICR